MTAVLQFAALILGTLGVVAVLVVIERRGHRPVQQGREAFGADERYPGELRWLRDQLAKDKAASRG